MPETSESIDQAPAAYDPPRVERVLTPEDLEREVHYAGASQ